MHPDLRFNDLIAQQSQRRTAKGGTFGCYYCGQTVSQAVHMANTAYCCRECFVKHNPDPMPEVKHG
jgi:cysteinyl-tRNA synthetase